MFIPGFEWAWLFWLKPTPWDFRRFDCDRCPWRVCVLLNIENKDERYSKITLCLNLLVVKWLVLWVGHLCVLNPFNQIIVICTTRVVLLGHAQRILIWISTIFFFFTNYIFVVLQKLGRFIFCRWVRLILILLITLVRVTIITPGLWSIWNNLSNVDNAAITLVLANHGCHHTLWEIVRLR